MKVYEIVITNKYKYEVCRYCLSESEATLKSMGDLIPYINRINELGYFVSQINFLDMSLEEFVKVPASFLSKEISEGVLIK